VSAWTNEATRIEVLVEDYGPRYLESLPPKQVLASNIQAALAAEQRRGVKIVSTSRCERDLT
jgi:hypothetical protein